MSDGADSRLIDAGLLTIVSTRRREDHVITIYGQLDAHTSRLLRDEFWRVERSEVPRIVVDLSRLNFVDASGIRQMLHAQARVRRTGDCVVFVRAPDRVQNAFRLTGAEELLDFLD